MSRKHYEWKLRDQTLHLGERTLVMGILNITPDSFSDGGKYADPDRAFARALELEEQGADIIDIGAESTRPGSSRISEAEELRRLIPVLKRLQNGLHIPISIDTYKSGVAAKALDLGAAIINDPSGLTWDPELARAIVQADAGLVLNHMRGTPQTWAKLPPLKDPLSTIATDLDSAMHRAVRAGLDRKRIVIDPGLGFGKRKEQNAEILGRLDELAKLDLPLLVGASRKHFVAKGSPEETEFASAAAVAAAILYGAHIVRVHDVKAMRAVVEVADEIARVRAEREEAERAARAARQEEIKREGARLSGARIGAARREGFPPGVFVAGGQRPATPVRPSLRPAAGRAPQTEGPSKTPAIEIPATAPEAPSARTEVIRAPAAEPAGVIAQREFAAPGAKIDQANRPPRPDRERPSYGGRPAFGRTPFKGKNRPGEGKRFGGKKFEGKPFRGKASSGPTRWEREERPDRGKPFRGRPSKGRPFGAKPPGGKPGGKGPGRRPPSRG